MTLYDEVLRQMYALLPEKPSKQAFAADVARAPWGAKDQILFRADTAFELGGPGKPSVGTVLFADLEDGRDEVCLYGPDLSEISADAPFGHLTVASLNETGEEVFSERLKEIGFTAFQYYLRDYHVRISPSSGREIARVAKAAVTGSEPLSFLQVGASLIDAFLKHADVRAVKTVFITDPDFDYATFSILAGRARQLTNAAVSVLKLDEVNCGACRMKPVCDEVEGLRELHFKKRKEEK